MNGAQAVSGVDIGVTERMRLCLAESDLYFSGYDTRLLRPETVPKLVRFALPFMRITKLQVRTATQR
ncbi:hypothetical protein [Paraburkholderia ferrariae]|uniref:hypothetical protein n=1 Tax=Paraburkholderia ferrariae TaxID=386056 RepID=UPI00048374BF|nr:hypothetical protein [Paraburkholderia ferrariae]